ncbi:crotonobetainyl-CoA:carnitine CoA-transferase CaiB-like acyl-CoA transferase [Bradyrhizobium sp. LB1.3]
MQSDRSQSISRRSGPLAGLKVIDLTHVMAGPTCTLMLADMGADVIKIEKSPNGDDTRHSVPPKIGDEAASFLMMNRNKRGIVLDLKTDGGKAVLRRLIADADVLVENFAPGAMERLGFGYEALHEKFPTLIYCSLSGFGRTGPYKHRRGFDLVAQAMSGIMSFTGERPDGPPVKCGPPLSDITAGLLASMGILAAYTHRLKTGEGQWVETSLYEAALVQTYWQSTIALAAGTAPRAMGSAHPLNAPYQAFEASDGWLVVGGANKKHWLLMLEALGASELAARSALRHRGRPHGAFEGARSRPERALPHPDPGALARGAGREGRSVRTRARHAGGAQRSADAGARDGRRGRALHARSGEDHRSSRQVFGDPRQSAYGRAGLR